jgi:phthalate 4,5-dioxygenase oxygenase subunit
MSTPIDDTNTSHWMMRYNRARPLRPSFINPVSSLEERTNYPPRPPGGPDDGWGQDRGAMVRGHFTGFQHVNTEDFAIIESQGAILDRTKEQLNPGDRAVVFVRRHLLDAVREAEAGKQPTLADHENIAYGKIKADVLTITKGDDWRSHLKGVSAQSAAVEQSTDAHV